VQPFAASLAVRSVGFRGTNGAAESGVTVRE